MERKMNQNSHGSLQRILPGWLGYLVIAAFGATFLILSGCGGRAVVQPPHPPTPAVQSALVEMGYTIQAGAFARVENAANLAENLRRRGIDATYFRTEDGLYKVRFGNYPSRETARSRAESLRKAGMIEAFYIVSPDQYAAARTQTHGTSYVRAEIVKTARSFLGVPYLWGGDSPETGFDCSGLTSTSYRLNGLDLPRMSQDQFRAGNPVERTELLPGDLVFFGNSNDKITHVGIYVGGDRFIHAPGQGKTIREDALSDGYFAKRFQGGRSYFIRGA